MTSPAAGASRPLLGLILALAGALIITPDTLLIRLSGLEGWGLSFWRGILIGAGLMVFWLALERRRVITQIPMLLTGPAIVIIIANFFNAISFNFATMETSITVVVTALATAPLIAAVLGFFVLGERMGMKTWIAVAVSMVGVMIVILNGEGALDAPPGKCLAWRRAGVSCCFWHCRRVRYHAASS